ncbi:uncharacterized protein LY89DRAFT_95884 [Mollisia scopiformis]|uniref:Zn(2)-C6 fungal-type domain-containing protein n=1 Tax=Mollisia scopiformis TaxID=149040 RepID=A0A194X7J9_MOLSC|nr:uncharacterized protein LY89DRAFT_95884 [Mollisia scopiformis]KUJ15782.1 hypothetical protein LY89DRAFT_95884 [Mollisia scopiformis]
MHTCAHSQSTASLRLCHIFCSSTSTSLPLLQILSYLRESSRISEDGLRSTVWSLLASVVSMASQASSPSISGQGHGSEGNKNRPKSNITRVRTGCFTCRKRRKKCDERRPICSNCQRTNVVCEGFPQQVFWETRSAARRAVVSRSNSVTSPTFYTSPTSGAGIPDLSMDFGQWIDHLPSQFSPPYQGHALARLEDRPLDDDMGYIFDQFNGSAIGGVASLDQAPGFLDYQGISRELVIREDPSQERAITQNAFQEAFIPIELPFLITGVDTTIHQRLFCHFTGVMSQLLTTFSGQSNPFNQVVIPMAMEDHNVMDTLLCLAGSHLLKVQPTVLNGELLAEKRRLHENALRTQELRVQDLRKSFTGSGLPYSIQYQETVLATSLLLCLFEICEGSSDGSWKYHLKIAREIITMASESQGPGSPSSRTTDINPFLLEFFLYHDSLATVTSPSNPVNTPKFRNKAEISDQDTSMVGVQDGLIEFIIQISALRAEADASNHQPDGNVICKAVQIWQDLANWRPRSITTKERRLITEFYQWALFIWLYSIVYPDGKADAKVQSAVQRIAEGMCEINSGDGVMACLLFPLFVIGSAAITNRDRETVLAHFRKLRNWSALGNIDLTEKVVRKMWMDHDVGLPGSWDWVKQLETHGMSLLVT